MTEPRAMRDPVEAQLEAYNARDVERFVLCFTDDVVVEDAKGTLLLAGRDAFRASYAAMFEASPALHCRVVSRMRAGAFVVDEERVTGRGEAELHVIVVYTLRDDRIAHVRVLR
ncbi:MAG: nuclear transport factor 2 family protein [Sandaracinaceae bacterium]|nr:nuclear transport factor 2 family protein [Sandaracinaceae bacterium]